MSKPAPVLSSVPQGTALDPLLFLAYINDTNEQHLSPGSQIRLFVEDSLLYRNILTPKESVILQGELNVLQAWEHENKMEFHPDKCQVLPGEYQFGVRARCPIFEIFSENFG